MWVLFAVLGSALLLLVGVYFFFNPIPGSNCADMYVYCPIGPSSAIPLGTAIAIGNGTGSCPAGNAPSSVNCAYSFPVTATYAPAPSAGDLTSEIQNASYELVNTTYVVIVATPEESLLGTWYSSNASWAKSPNGPSCGGTDCLTTPLSMGDLLIIRSVPDGGLPYSHQDDQLLVIAVGGGFGGAFDTPIS
jgi:hypothetical protein